MLRVFNTTQSDLIKYNGTYVKLGRELNDAERDPEVGRMWFITFYDGKEGQAFEDELSPLYIISQAELEAMVRFGMAHPNDNFNVEPLNDGEDFLSCTFFDSKTDNNSSGIWELLDYKEA